MVLSGVGLSRIDEIQGEFLIGVLSGRERFLFADCGFCQSPFKGIAHRVGVGEPVLGSLGHGPANRRRQSLTRDQIRTSCEGKSMAELYDDLLTGFSNPTQKSTWPPRSKTKGVDPAVP